MSEDLVLTPAAERVLEVAGKLFYDNGIHAVGVESIASEAGVTKKTLYDRFGSKDALVGQYLKRRDERYREHVRSVVERRGRIAPARRVLLVFDALEEWIATENPRGCAFVNAQAELPDATHPAREVIREQKQWMLDYLRTLVRDVGVRNPRKLATSLLNLLEGATVTASLGIVPGAVGNAKEVARQLLDQG
ncbi:TetR/AcrR family transcriptional regulator [Saccharomonospora piscinae]|uniref:TetR family transcriptional regulator n=1 Tax=Saccharomonospora piscinae TaxID=687388 RepID=A0A1V9A5W8_SACPI|nr:TetR/AcrR family transcriptional regulator [Saccharomonospora piscinae]OQO92438.1 TetR family transcriptional regulator [Saccharomonospora piscinae]TLW91845.1 TetR/AcrR family transcriptional regulator [Saccharomonospora piscinae]